MILIKTYTPMSREPVWSVFDPAKNTLLSFHQHKHLATSIINARTGQNKRPRYTEYTFYEHLVHNPDKAAVWSPNTFQFSGTITNEQRRFFHLIREPALTGYHDWNTLQAFAQSHHIALDRRNKEDTLLEYSFIYTWLKLADRPMQRKKMYPIHQIADYIADWTRSHLAEGDLLHISHPDHDLITLAAIELGIENTGDKKVPYLNYTQNQRRKHILKLPRKLYGDVLDYTSIHDPKKLKRRFRSLDEKRMIQPPLNSMQFSDILKQLNYSDARELEHMARMMVYSNSNTPDMEPLSR